jgi:hypothetical protein
VSDPIRIRESSAFVPRDRYNRLDRRESGLIVMKSLAYAPIVYLLVPVVAINEVLDHHLLFVIDHLPSQSHEIA